MPLSVTRATAVWSFHIERESDGDLRARADQRSQVRFVELDRRTVYFKDENDINVALDHDWFWLKRRKAGTQVSRFTYAEYAAFLSTP